MPIFYLLKRNIRPNLPENQFSHFSVCETVSDVYYRKNPRSNKTIIKGKQLRGIDKVRPPANVSGRRIRKKSHRDFTHRNF
jgi:hypothetical protein